MGRIVIVGTFDSKAEPLGLLIDMLRDRGEEPVTIDTSVFSTDMDVTYGAAEVAARAGMDHAALPDLGRAKAVDVMAEGAGKILGDLQSRREVAALVAMGGSNVATVFSKLAPVLPMGLPKILLGTTVAGDTRGIVGGSDAILLYSVVDVDGDNAIIRHMIRRLADTAIALKASEPIAEAKQGSKRIALSMYGVTTPCVQQIAGHLRAESMEPLVFHANGPGGRSIESFAAERLVDAVVDVTLTELGNELLGGGFPAGVDRMSSAARFGIPQVMAPGAIDMIAFGARNTVPERFADHTIHAHNALVTLVRTTPDDCRAIGRLLAERLGTPTAPTTVCIPLGGTSMMDKVGEVFFDPDAVQAFAGGLKEGASDRIRIVTAPDNINDPGFADLMFGELQRVLEESSGV